MATSFEEVKALCKEFGFSLPDRDIELNVNALNVMADLTNGKLTTRELFEAYDFLNDLITGKKPSYAIMGSTSESIRVQSRIMEEIPQTAGKLTPEEKELFAFCVYHITYGQVYNEKTGTISSGLVDFDSTEHVRMIYEDLRRLRPSLFTAATTCDSPVPDDYGLSKEHPVMLTSVRMSYMYLDSLCYRGQPVTYNRLGSTSNGRDILDVYDVSSADGERWTLYIDAYADTPVKRPPKGLSLKGF